MHITSTEIKSFYSGIILSDGTIDKGVHKRALRMASIDKSFVDYLEKFTNQFTYFTTYIQEKEANTDKNNVNHKKFWNFNIKAHPYFNKMYHQFYDDYRKKYISKEILHILDLRGLANWYMGDGYITLVGKESNEIYDRRVQICTDCFSKSDCELFASFLKEKFGYETRLIARKPFWRVQIALKSAQNFFMDIRPYILPGFYYKINMQFIEKPEWMREDYFEFMQCLNSADRSLLEYRANK